jgi:hypothetical protein
MEGSDAVEGEAVRDVPASPPPHEARSSPNRAHARIRGRRDIRIVFLLEATQGGDRE